MQVTDLKTLKDDIYEVWVVHLSQATANPFLIDRRINLFLASNCVSKSHFVPAPHVSSFAAHPPAHSSPLGAPLLSLVMARANQENPVRIRIPQNLRL
jgi:hypothetical protein